MPNDTPASEVELEVARIGKRARFAARRLAMASTSLKNAALEAAADALIAAQEPILAANSRDVARAREAGLKESLIDRLALSETRMAEIAEALREMVTLPDPTGVVVSGSRRPNGLDIQEVSVPLGVVGMIYESRPNVTVDAIGLCLKSGNAVILRGSKDAIDSNCALVDCIRPAIESAGLPADCAQLIRDPDRASAQALMRCNEYVDILIPRGGAGLIQAVVENSTVPVIETGVGNCHTFVDASADLDKALAIAINAKCQRPGVCNAMETLLVHTDVAAEFIPCVVSAMAERGCEVRGCERTVAAAGTGVLPASDADWATEFLDLILAIRVVDTVEDAVEHITEYGSLHSEAIVTRDIANAEYFLRAVDAAAVYVNASTRFTDGGQFGMAGEIGISTQKLHARGPFGLEKLVSTKYIIRGSGQVRE